MVDTLRVSVGQTVEVEDLRLQLSAKSRLPPVLGS